MIFPLVTFPSPTPIPSLRGGIVRCKPLIFIDVIGPSATLTSQILVDTGADDIVFPAALASRIGVNLTAVAQRQARGVGSTSAVQLLFAPVILRLSDQIETCRWHAVVAFTTAPLRVPLFGIASGLEYFRTILDVEAQQLELLAKPSLPSTQSPTP